MAKPVVLERSTNTHITNSPGVSVQKEIQNMTTILLSTQGAMIVEHGHHHTVATSPSTGQVVKITQQEYNPVLNAFQNSFD